MASSGKQGLSRRGFLKLGLGVAACAAALGAAARLGDSALFGGKGGDDARWVRKSPYCRKLAGGEIECQLCPRHCRVPRGGRGHCEVRENRGGDYYTLVYGRAASVNIDPIEKKPLFHVLPGSLIFSFATAGCNLDCNNCQNWQLSQSRPEDLSAVDLPPAKLIAAAQGQGVKLIAGTYNEPTIFTEYLLDVAREGKKRGVRTCTVSNGFINQQPMLDLLRELAAVKIDLKGIRNEFYQRNCGAWVQPVLDTIELVKKQGVWLEIVYLVIPTLNDSEKDIKELCRWVHAHVGLDTPLHFSRFHPDYRLRNLPPTPYETLDRCYQIARAEGLRYVYVGNIPGHHAESTFCPQCGKVIIGRQGFQITATHLVSGKCGYCGRAIPGIWA
jgi:pyruvate formate lyase activating enzyme